jgi:hypothetical protein
METEKSEVYIMCIYIYILSIQLKKKKKIPFYFGLFQTRDSRARGEK